MSYLTQEIVNDIENYNTEDKVYTDFYFDEESHSFSGGIVDKIEALKGYIYLALNVDRYKYPIYSFDYGNEISTIIAEDIEDELLESKCKQFIKDALLINPYIKDITDINVERNNTKVSIDFIVNSIYGDVYIKI